MLRESLIVSNEETLCTILFDYYIEINETLTKDELVNFIE